MIITVEVGNCRQCLFRGHYKGRHLCLATRLGESVGAYIPIPTRLPNKYVPEFVARGKPYPDPPKWCPLSNRCIIVGQEGQIPKRVTEIPSLWPKKGFIASDEEL